MRPVRFRADWVLPVSGAPVRDGALLVDEHGRIAAVGPDARVPRPDDAEHTDLGAAALLPGLVNVHAHPELSALRGALEDLPFRAWIDTLRDIKRAAPLDAADLFDSALAQVAEAFAAGITTLGATEDSDASLQALGRAGGRGVVYREVFGPAPGQCDTALAGLRARVAGMRALAPPLVHIGVSPHAPYTVSDELLRAVAEYAAAEALPIAVHIAESAIEVELVVNGAGEFAGALQQRGIGTSPRARSPVALLEHTGILALRPLLIHCVHIDDADVRAIAAHGASVAHCPVANARLGHGIAPIAELLAAGVTVGLGSDSVASNNRMDLLEEARTAQLLQRARLHSHDVLSAEQLLRLATLEGARALGLEHEVGALETGKSADLCAVSLAGPHVHPVHDPNAALIHAARGSDVVLTMVAGRVVYRAGRHTTIDVPVVTARVAAIAERVAAARTAAP